MYVRGMGRNHEARCKSISLSLCQCLCAHACLPECGRNVSVCECMCVWCVSVHVCVCDVCE